MLLSEQEAKTKWCVRTNIMKCVASDCMGWRWATTTVTGLANVPPDANTEWAPSGPKFTGDDGRELQRWELVRGYCGLAGKPFE